MNLVLIAAFIAVCGAAKLDRSYLPPPSASTAGGSPGSLQAPLTRTSDQGLETPKLPTGSYTNDFQGVVIDAAAPGTRASSDDLTGLGGPRPSYGSTDSKVGDAAFRGTAGFRTPFGASVTAPVNDVDQSNGSFENKSERPQAAYDRNSNIVAFNNDVSSDNYSYGFETDNGIAVGENGVAVNGVQAEGGYSYQGDDGQVYRVTYTADEGGYRPQGAHLPTPHPIPEEILKSIEKNAEEEAAGLVDDGSYNAQKYNADGDYTHDNGGNTYHNGIQSTQFGKRPESDATASGTFIKQSSQAFANLGSSTFESNSQSGNGNNGKPNVASSQFGSNSQSAYNGQSSQGNGNNGKPDVALSQFGSNSQSAFNGQSSQGNGNNGKPNVASSQFGLNSQSAYNGQSSQGNGNNGKPNVASSQFGANSQSAYNGQSSQGNGNNDFGKPIGGSSQFESNSQSAYNGQSSQGNGNNGKPNVASSQFGSNSQSAYKGQSSQGNGNNGKPNVASSQFVSNSQSAYNGQLSEGNGNNGKPNVASSQFGTNSQSAYNGQSSQGNGNNDFGKPIGGSSQFESNSQSAYNGQSSQGNANNAFGKPTAATSQFGLNSQSAYNGQSSQGYAGSSTGTQNTNSDNQSQVNGKPEAHFGSTSNDLQSSFHSQAIQFNTNPVSTQNVMSQGHSNQHESTVHQSSGFNAGSYSSQAQFSQFGQQPSVVGNQSPNTGAQQTQQGFNAQSGSNPTKPLFGSNVGAFASNSEPTHTQFSQPLNYQGSGNFVGSNQGAQSFGQSSNNHDKQGQYQSSSTGFSQTSSSPTSQFGSDAANSFNRFPQPTPGQTNEYLPPNKQSKPSSPGFNSNFGISGPQVSGTNSHLSLGAEKNDKIPDFIAPNKQIPSISSASASVQPNFQPKPFKTFDQTQFNKQASLSQLNNQSGSKPTGVPDTELTTPLEPSKKPSSYNSQFSSQTSTNLESSDKSENNQPQTQFGYQGNSAFGRPSTSQNLSPSFPTSSPQYGMASSQPAFPEKVTGNSNNKPNFPQNSFISNQASFNQGFDNSYKYNQQPKPSVSAVQPQVSKLPGSPSYQSNGVVSQNQFFSQQNSFQNNKFSGSQLAPVAPTLATQFAQTQSLSSTNFNGITQAAISPFPSVSPSSSGQVGGLGSKPSFNQQSTFGNQFQLSQNKPTSSQQPSRYQSSPISSQNTKPSQAETQFGQSETTPESSEVSTQQQTTISQQYEGTVYQYNKPAEVLPAPTQTDSSSSQTIQAGVTSESKPQENHGNTNVQSQFGQNLFSSQAQQGLNQGSKFGAQPNKPFGSSPTLQLPKPQQTNGIQLGSQPTPFGASSTSSQISQNAQSVPVSTTSAQNYQTGSYRPFGAASQGGQSSFGSRPQFGSQPQTQLTQTQSFESSQTNQQAPVPQSQYSTFGNSASSQGNGYFYPKNPIPQFNEYSQQQSGPNSQPGSEQGSGIFNQNIQTSSKPSGPYNQQISQNQFNSIKPQFGAESQTQFEQQAQTHFGHSIPNSPNKPISQAHISQASSQATASGHASASAQASSLPQHPQNFGIPEKQDQNGQSTQFGAYKPFGNNNEGPSKDSKPYGALNSKPFGANGSTISNNSPCCQGIKDSTSAQSTVAEQASFPGTQNINAQNVAGKGEEFGGPREPPRFDDQTGYHY